MAAVDFPEGIPPNSFVPPSLPRRSGEAKKPGKGKGLFRTALGEAIDEEAASSVGAAEGFSDADVSRLLDEVHNEGDKLKENPTMDLVQGYKRAVRNFVHYIVEHTYSIEEKTSGGNILKRKKYYRIAVIDESLERLGAEILRNQRDKLEILRRVDEIYGMIVDLLR
jgi:hypothetical protein